MTDYQKLSLARNKTKQEILYGKVWEVCFQNRRLPFKTRKLEHMPGTEAVKN